MWGWVFILLGLMVCLTFWFKNRHVGFLILGAYLVRMVAALIHKYVFILPAGCCDAVGFERQAWLWSELSTNFYYALFDPSQSYVVSWIGAGIYSVFGRDPLLLQMFNVFLGTITVFVVYRTALHLMRQEYAIVVGWMFALHPTVIEHSAVFLREAEIILCLALSIFFFVKWMKDYRPVFVLLSILSLIISTLFHGAMIMGLGGMIMVISGVLLYRSLLTVQTQKIRRGVIPTILVLACSVIVMFYLQELPRLSTIGDLQLLMESEQAAMRIGYVADVRSSGSAAYLEGLSVNSIWDVVWQGPIRSIYLLYSPFPWEITAFRHLKGFIDSGFLFYITYLIFRYRRELWDSPVYRALLIILLIYIFVFSFGSSNFGSAIRHKTKFMPLFVLFYGLKDLARSRRNISHQSS